MPVHKASENCPWLASLVESGAIYSARAWSQHEAYQFLQNIALFEAAGIVVALFGRVCVRFLRTQLGCFNTIGHAKRVPQVNQDTDRAAFLNL